MKGKALMKIFEEGLFLADTGRLRGLKNHSDKQSPTKRIK